MSAEKSWTEYVVRCRRWIRNIEGKKVWETVTLSAVSERQALDLYHDITTKQSALKAPRIIVRDITERPYRPKGVR